MAFRSKKDEHLEWKRWLQRHRGALLDCGLPVDHFTDQRNWQYFLGHATLEAPPDRHHWFRLESLSLHQLCKLYAFLQEEYGTQSLDPTALVVIKRLLGLPQRAGAGENASAEK